MIATRKLSGSNRPVTEIGLGCATFAFDASPQSIDDARQMLGNALNIGINHYDTSPFYGRGLSERLVGDALRGRTDLILSSKVGRLLHPDANASTHMPFRVAFDYSYDGVMKSVEHSYHRLGLSKIDILYAHDLGQYTHGDNASTQFATFFDGGGYRALEELRSSGDVGAIGLGVNEVSICQQVMEYGQFDVFLLAGRHTLIERKGALELFHSCEQTGTDIVIGGPFNSGMLVGGDTYNYRAIPEEVTQAYRQLRDYCVEQEVAMGAAALQFPLRHHVVKSVIPGPKNPAELEQILKWYNTEIPEPFWDGLDALNDILYGLNYA